MHGIRSPQLSGDAYRMNNRSSISTDFSETASFVSTAPSNVSSVLGEFSALCIHDYQSNDPHQLSFRKGDILAILKTEDTGWWAAALGSSVGWVPKGYVEPISDATADALKSVRRELRATADAWDGRSVVGSSSASSNSDPLDATPSIGDGLGSAAQRWGSGSSSRLPENNPSRQSLVPSVPRPQPLSNGTGGYITDYRTYPTAYGVRPTTGSRSSGRSNASVPRSQESYLATSPQPGGMGVPGPSGSPRGSRDEDARAYRNAKIAMAALPAHLQPDYGEGFLRLDPDGVVKSGTLEALVERLTVDPLKRSQETAYRMTFLMTYRSFTDGITVFELLVERYLMDNPPGLNEEQFTEWKEKRLRPAQTRVLTTFNEWVERYRFVKDEAHIVPKLKKFLSDIKTPPKNALTAKLLLQTIEKHEVAAATTAAASLHPVMTESSASGLSTSPSTSLSSKKSLKLSITASSGKQKAPKSDLLKFGYEELALHLTLVEYRLYAKVRPAECMAWPRGQRGSEVENLLRFCSTSNKLAAWVKYSILREDKLGRRADIIDFWLKVANKCYQLNNISSMAALVAALASVVIIRLSLSWGHVRFGSLMEPMLALTDPSGNFAAYRKFYDKVNTSCVPFVGIYLTQLVHYADQYPDTLQVAVPPSSMNTPQVPSSPKSGSSASTGKSTQAPSSHHSQQQLVQTTTHINFTRLFKCAEVIHQMLRHQVRGYRQANPSATAMHPVPDPSSAQGIDLGVENAQVMAYVEIMLNTGGVGMAPPEGLPLMNPSAHVPPALGAEGAGGPSVQLVSHGQVGVVEAWYWQRSSELHDIEVETSDIRRGLEAAGF